MFCLQYDFSIIVPAKDEEESLPLLFRNILEKRAKFSWNCELIIVDDHSKDGTWNLIKKIEKKHSWVKGIKLSSGFSGMGAALIEGTKKAKSDIIIWLMADLSDELDTINSLVQCMSSGFDLAIAGRKLSLAEHGFKGILSRAYSNACRLFFDLEVRDATNAFRAFNKKILNHLTLERSDFAISPELTLKAHLNGFRIAEVCSRYRKRCSGKSKFRIMFMALPYINVFFKLFIAKIIRRFFKGYK